MSAAKANPKVEFYFRKATKWHDEVAELRKIVLSCDVTEELKWGQPCYTNEGRNICLIHDFKEYCALLFMKGALMKDPEGILIQQTKNVQAARQLRFASVEEIAEWKGTIKSYIAEAIKIEASGEKIKLKKEAEPAPEELEAKFEASPKYKQAFYALTPGRQRGYILYFNSAKQSKTRVARIEKSFDKILRGKGPLED